MYLARRKKVSWLSDSFRFIVLAWERDNERFRRLFLEPRGFLGCMYAVGCFCVFVFLEVKNAGGQRSYICSS
jgi:hypothetical protein